jgi:cytochrome c-type biogenesis protein CcmE
MIASRAQRPRTATRRALLAGALGVAGIGYLAWTSTRATLVYYLTVDELVARGAEAYDRPVRVSGRIADGTLSHDAAIGQLSFRVADAGGSLPVIYRGQKPDLLGYSAQGAYQDVVVEGRLGPDGVLHATALIVKHGAEFAAAGTRG